MSGHTLLVDAIRKGRAANVALLLEFGTVCKCHYLRPMSHWV